MKTLKYLIVISLIILTGMVAFGLFSMPKVENIESESFSAHRVAQDIKIISKEPHSVEHPQARSDVRNYLVSRLEELGGKPEVYYYDSIPFRIGGTGTIGNVYCEFNPRIHKANSYVLLIAHLDSRYVQEVLGKSVYSYGAADDGYGLGITLELISQALKYQTSWKQGIKVLFTDAEENGLDGIENALSDNPELFDNVALVVNLEAKGVKGPALLFELSDGNDRLLELYKYAEYPYAYGISNAIYQKMTNFTDFTPLRSLYPGYNFSVIDNYKYYHTDKDNYSNISLESIQHYGAQLEPMLQEYLMKEKYSNPDYFRVTNNQKFFTLPFLGLFSLSSSVHLAVNIIFFVLFITLMACAVLLNIVVLSDIIKRMFSVFIHSILLLGIGTSIAYISAKIAGDDFGLISTKYVPFDYAIMIGSIVLLIIGYTIYLSRKTKFDYSPTYSINSKHHKRSKHFHRSNFYAAMILMVIYSIILCIAVGDSFFLIVPLLCPALAILTYKIRVLNTFFSVMGILITILLGCSFLYILYTALTIGSLGIILFISYYYTILIAGLMKFYSYTKNGRETRISQY